MDRKTKIERTKERNAEIERVNNLNEKRIKAGLLPAMNWAYIEKREEEAKQEIEEMAKSTISLERVAEISMMQNSHRYKNSPITNPQKIDISMQLTAGQLPKLSFGCIPKEMDEKWSISNEDVSPYSSFSWFVFCEDDCLFFHRAWTNRGIYKTQLLKENDGYHITEFWAERNPEIWESNYDRDIEIFSTLVAYLINRQKY